MSARLPLCGGVVLALMLGVAGAAAGHAFLDRAEPRVGARVRTPPAQVTLWFTERLEPAYSRVQVVNEAGRRVDKDDGAVVGDGRQLRISLEAVPAGAYQVRWRVLSVDTHITEGDFAFHIGP
jgi:methionine-rich copper-binding protein CopC